VESKGLIGSAGCGLLVGPVMGGLFGWWGGWG
jgi:hypothetical protein